MARSSRTLPSCLLALAIVLATGCLPRGPFPPATLFGEGDGPDCAAGSCSRCRAGRHHDQSEPANNDAGQSPLMAPISNFHPVPTRPVFTPWVVENPPPPEEISGQLAWKHALRPAGSGEFPSAPPLIDQPSSTPIARRTLPAPANLPDEKPVSLQGNKNDTDSRGTQATPDWHATGPRF